MSFREEFTLFQDIIRVIELRVLIVAVIVKFTTQAAWFPWKTTAARLGW